MTPISWKKRLFTGRVYDGSVVRVGANSKWSEWEEFRWHKDWRWQKRSDLMPPLDYVAVSKENSNVQKPRLEWDCMGFVIRNLSSVSFQRPSTQRRRRLWSRKEYFTPWKYFRRNSWIFFQQGGTAGTTWYVWVWNQISHPLAVVVLLLHAGYYILGSPQIIFKSCPRD